MEVDQNSKFYSNPSGMRDKPCLVLMTETCSRRQCWFYRSSRDGNQAYWPTQKGLVHLPYVWRKPRITGLKGTLRMNWIHFSASEKDCICTLLCQRVSVSETRLFKNLVRASLVAQWLRIHLPSRGPGFEPWSGKIPHAAEQLSPCATTTEPVL